MTTTIRLLLLTSILLACGGDDDTTTPGGTGGASGGATGGKGGGPSVAGAGGGGATNAAGAAGDAGLGGEGPAGAAGGGSGDAGAVGTAGAGACATAKVITFYDKGDTTKLAVGTLVRGAPCYLSEDPALAEQCQLSPLYRLTRQLVTSSIHRDAWLNNWGAPYTKVGDCPDQGFIAPADVAARWKP